MILVVGATGQLGTAIVRKLRRSGHEVRALVRSSSDYRHLQGDEIEFVHGDLRDRLSLDAACAGIDTVIATANTAIPREKGDTFTAVDRLGYVNLIDAAKQAGVRQFIYCSVMSYPGFDELPLIKQKRATEEKLKTSGLDFTIFRAEAFMDVSFAMMGSDIPIKGSEAPTVSRPFWFTTKFFESVRNNITKSGTIGIACDGKSRRSYICIDDVAEFHVRAIGHPAAKNQTFDLGGPEALSQLDIKALFEKVLGTRLKARYTPATVFKLGYRLLAPFSPAASNIMGLNYFGAIVDSEIDMRDTARTFGIELTSAEGFLSSKAPRKVGNDRGR